jgi:hypothetical protein
MLKRNYPDMFVAAVMTRPSVMQGFILSSCCMWETYFYVKMLRLFPNNDLLTLYFSTPHWIFLYRLTYVGRKLVFSPLWACQWEGKSEFVSMKNHLSLCMIKNAHDKHHTKEAINDLTHEIFIAIAVYTVLNTLMNKHIHEEVKWM